MARTHAEWEALATRVTGKTIISLLPQPETIGESWVMTVAGDDGDPIVFDADATEHQLVGCHLRVTPAWAGQAPILACARFITGPNGAIMVGDEGVLRLGPGAWVRALPWGGLEIVIPGEVDMDQFEQLLGKETPDDPAQ